MSTHEIQNGSLKQLWKISLPLMISFFSTVAMLFVDRLFLSFYSPLALNAASSSGTLAWALIWGLCTLANMAEVFVAQYNGAKRYEKLGEPVWQMVWLGVFSIAIYILIGFFGARLLYGNSELGYELDYFRYMMYFSPFFVLSGALSAFYIGQGKTQVIKWLAVLSNVINVILDPIFIFGIKGYFPAMGIKGAAIATGIGMAVQCVILLKMILHKNNRLYFGTADWRFKPSAFIRIVKVGTPPAIFVTLEMTGWAIFYTFMSMLSTEHIMVASVCQSILILFIFFGLGLEKGAAAIAGNMIGAKRVEEIKVVMKSGLKMIAFFSIILLFFTIIYPSPIIDWFFQNPEALENTSSLGALSSAQDISKIKSLVRIGLVMIFFYMTLENIRWLLSGILTAAGDTMFLLIAGSISVWLFLIAPTYFIIVKMNQSITTAMSIWVVYSVIATGLYFWRYRSGKWKQKQIIEESDQAEVEEEMLIDG